MPRYQASRKSNSKPMSATSEQNRKRIYGIGEKKSNSMNGRKQRKKRVATTAQVNLIQADFCVFPRV